MPYIDDDYYLNTYKGTLPPNIEDLDKLIRRSYDIVDLLTNYTFVTGKVDFDSYNPMIKTQVMKATSALVEHYVIHGGYDAVKQSQSISSTNIGSLNFSMREVQEVPDLVFSLLYSTGLMYTGIGSL